MLLKTVQFKSTPIAAAAPLYGPAQDIGRLANFVQEATDTGLQVLAASLPDNLHDWELADVPEQHLAPVFELIGNATQPIDRIKLRDRLLALEGGLWGEMVRYQRLPSAALDLMARRLDREVSITRESISQAHRQIREPWVNAFRYHAGIDSVESTGFVERTSLIASDEISSLLGRPVFLKMESEQAVGSFKNRGATNLLLHQLIPYLVAGGDINQVRVVTASHGNAAQGVVQAAHNLGVRNVIVYLPENASELKVQQLREQGAVVHFAGETFEEAEIAVEAYCHEHENVFFVPAFRHDLIAEGQGTIGLEVSQQMAAFGHNEFAVIAASGGQGLLSGLSVALSSGIPLFGVESERLPLGSRAIRAGHVVTPQAIRHIDTIADGSALLQLDERLFDTYIKGRVTDIVSIPEFEIEGGIAAFQDWNLTVEGSAAATLGALLFGGLDLKHYDIPAETPVVLLVSGQNIDEHLLAPIEARFGNQRWRYLDRSLQRRILENALRPAGFMKRGEVRPLVSADRPVDFVSVIEFVDTVADKLPEHWDLIDAFQQLDFGPWQDVKGPRASFRSMGEYNSRDYPEAPNNRGDRAYALGHPLGNRASNLIQFAGILRSNEERFNKMLTDMAAIPGFSLPLLISRMAGELRVIQHYRARPTWQARLWPHLGREERRAEIEKLWELAQRVHLAIVPLLQAIDVPFELEQRLLSELRKPLDL